MAIGNAPWPIGVTMVGIHARTGREKIFSKHVAHVLNDETQRKYIQVSYPDWMLSIKSCKKNKKNGEKKIHAFSYDEDYCSSVFIKLNSF